MELISPELELNCKNGIDPDSDAPWVFCFYMRVGHRILVICKYFSAYKTFCRYRSNNSWYELQRISTAKDYLQYVVLVTLLLIDRLIYSCMLAVIEITLMNTYYADVVVVYGI